MAFSDEQILNSIKKGGDNKVLTYLYKTYFPRVKKLVVSNCGKQEDAEDIFQEAIVAFYKHVTMERFKEEYEIGAFIYTVARNLWINQAKRKKINLPVEDNKEIPAEYTNALDSIISNERELLVKNIINQLGERCKELLTHTIYHKLSMKEVCEKMGFSTEDGAKTKNYKCKQRLIELMKKNPTIQELL